MLPQRSIAALARHVKNGEIQVVFAELLHLETDSRRNFARGRLRARARPQRFTRARGARARARRGARTHTFLGLMMFTSVVLPLLSRPMTRMRTSCLSHPKADASFLNSPMTLERRGNNGANGASSDQPRRWTS